MNGYYKYRKATLKTLSEKVRNEKPNLESGTWRGVQKTEYTHILPIKEETKEAKRKAIKDWLGVVIDDRIPRKSKNSADKLHPYAHHLNSSQLLCYTTFDKLLDGNKPKAIMIQLMEELGLPISKDAVCAFEYNDMMRWEEAEEYEGTSFDFHIKDKDSEFFFEIKFTEQGFGKAKNDERHKNKIAQLYKNKIDCCPFLKSFSNDSLIMENYQLIRNVIRCKDKNTYVVFITDANNPETTKAIINFKSHLKEYERNIRFITWQEIKKAWEKHALNDIPFQFVCF